MKLDLMIDIETMSTRPNANITQISAVPFNPRIYPTLVESDAIFDIHTEPVRCRDTDPQTFMWWLSQSKAAQSRMTNANRMALPEALVELTEFIKRGDYRYIWAKPRALTPLS